MAKGWATTDIGNVKKQNEDDFLLDEDNRVFVVADGVSGRKAGDVASDMITTFFAEHADELRELVDRGDALEDDIHRERVLHRLTELVQQINTRVYDMGKEPEYHGGMASTLVALVLGQDAGFVAHVGDSRVYLRREARIFRITEDHTYAAELRKYSGDEDLPPQVNERFSHVLTRSIGGRPKVDVDVVFFELQPGDSFLLCSDGLTDYLAGAEILEMMQDHDPEEIADVLVDEAKERGGRDNITTVYVELTPVEPTLELRQSTRLDTLRKISLLADMTLFQDLSRVELLKMLRVVYEQTYALGEAMLQEGEPGAAIFLIVEGEVAVSRQGKHLATLEPGDHFGEFSLFESSRNTASVQAASDEVLVLALPLQQFRDLMRDDITLGNKLLWNLMRQMARHIQTMNERLVDEGFAQTLELRALDREMLKEHQDAQAGRDPES